MTKVVIVRGTTANEVGKDKPTRFLGGEKADIVPDQAKTLLRLGVAVRLGSEAAREAVEKKKKFETPQRKAAKEPRANRLADLGEELGGGSRPDPDAGAQPGFAGEDEGEGEGDETETETEEFEEE